MTYVVKVILNDESVETFQYETKDAFSTLLRFQQDTTPQIVYARDNAKSIEIYPI